MENHTESPQVQLSKTQAEFKYNETRPSQPNHNYPSSDKIVLKDRPGAAARYLLEQASQRFGGLALENIEELGITKRDLVTHRGALHNALLAALRQGQSLLRPAERATAVAYLGALEFEEAAPILTSLSSSPAESTNVRGLAVESVARLGYEASQDALRIALNDPHPTVRKRAVFALHQVGKKADGELLSEVARRESDPEVRYQAEVAAAGLLGKTPPAKRPTSDSVSRQLIARPSITRPIGRHSSTLPQTNFTAELPENKQAAVVGRNLVSEQLGQSLHQVDSAGQVSYEVLDNPPPRMVRLRLVGADLSQQVALTGHNKLFLMSKEEAVVDLPSASLPQPGGPLPLEQVGLNLGQATPTWLPQAAAAPMIKSVTTETGPIWRGQSFGLRVRFWLPARQTAAILRVQSKLPLAPWHEATFLVSKEEQMRGEKIIPGYLSAVAGNIEVQVSLYTDQGSASIYETQLQALPTNPISMYVVPQVAGTNGEGPAHYNGSDDRFYCYARFEVANGFPFPVTLGPTLWCRVSDAGDEIDNFSGSIGTTTIAANSVQSLYIYTSHGSSSDAYDVFKDFGDVRIDFTLQTSQGNISDWNVWAAMAQIRLALNFVGNISIPDGNDFQSVVENEASAILEQQSLYITETAQFEIPSFHVDWHRYRDIRMNDNKNSDCSSGSDEAEQMCDDWSSPTNWLDVWIVESFSGPACAANTQGFSPIDGPTDNGGEKSGLVIKMAGVNFGAIGRQELGLTIAHELGHFLGLDHSSSSTNFMYKYNMRTNTGITIGQYRDMSDHGFVNRFAL